MQKKLRYILCAALLLVLPVLCGFTEKEKTQAPPPPAKELLICSSLDEGFTTLLANDFAKRTGTNVTIAYLPNGTFDERMNFLRENKFDCWFGGTAEEYYLADQQSMLSTYKANDAHKIPAQMRNRQGQWTSLYLEYIAFISHNPKFRKKGLYAPHTWQELLAPRLKNELVIPDFAQGGVGYGMITSVWQLYGEEEALAYAAKLNAQNITYTMDYAEAADLIYKGEKTVAVLPVRYALLLAEKHKHLFMTVIKDANRNLLTCAAVLAAGTNKEQAQEFIDYLLSDASEKHLRNNGYRYIWHDNDYPYNDGRRELIGNVQVPADDLSWTAVEKNEIISAWLRAE